MWQHNQPRISVRALCLGFGGILALAAPALAANNLTITPTFDSTITSLPNAAAVEGAINAAINQVTSTVTTRFPDPISIKFVNTTDPNSLGFSVTPTQDLAYSTYLSALQANPSKSVVQITALGNMPAGPNTGINGATQVLLTASNFAAVGQASAAAALVSGNGGFNSVITLNTSTLNTSRTSGQVDGNYDARSVAAHEINEVLGIGGNASTLFQPGNTPPIALPSDVGPLDFFRYASPGTRSFSYNNNAVSYFSIDGGATKLVNFNQVGAGGSDFGDWGDGVAGDQQGNTPSQVQDAFGTPWDSSTSSYNGGPAASLGVNEIDGLQVAGYNLGAVPEPASIGILAIGSLGLLSRRRRSA